MNTNQKLAIILLLLVLAIAAFAQQPHALTDTEQREYAQSLAVEKARTDTLTVAANDLLNTQPGPDSIAVHARYQSAWLALRLIQTERAAWLAKLQAAKGCKDCVISEDGKRLVEPEGRK